MSGPCLGGYTDACRVYLLEDLSEHSHARLMHSAGTKPLLQLQVAEDLVDKPADHQPLLLTTALASKPHKQTPHALSPSKAGATSSHRSASTCPMWTHTRNCHLSGR